MGRLIVAKSDITNGTTSRLIRNSWVKQDGVQAVAFDLRDGPPPEPYVSFSMTDGKSDDEHFRCSFDYLSKKMRDRPRGFIALFDIAICLDDVNDEDKDVIGFRDESLPHCGLYYLTRDLRKIQEAKTTLAYLASERLHKISDSLLIVQK